MYEGFGFVAVPSLWNVRVVYVLQWFLCITFVSLVGAVLEHYILKRPWMLCWGLRYVERWCR